MKDIILKWWNRKWSDWEHYTFVKSYDAHSNRAYREDEVFISHSNDGLHRYKRVKIW